VEGDTTVKPWLPWEEWLETAMTGEPAYDRMHGGVSYWDALRSDPSARAMFDMSLHQISSRQISACLELLDLGDRRRLVDVGTGEASWLTALLTKHPELLGVGMDLEEALAGALQTLASAGVDDRGSVVAGDFFEAVPEGDAMLLANVLHDWDDDRAGRILDTCRRSLAPGGRIWIVERIIPDGDTPHHAKSVDINMLFLLGGRERTLLELQELLHRNGFTFIRCEPTSLAVSVITASVED
jgi:cyclopropane fatty-acyl-phospholipid synthase-like methyltransferase